MVDLPRAAVQASTFLLLSTIRRPHSIIHRLFCSSLQLLSTSNDDEIIILSSLQSATVKHIRNLLHKRKSRVDFGETIVEGPRMVFDLLRNDETRQYIKQILVSVDHWDAYASDLHELVPAATATTTLKANDTHDEALPRVRQVTPQVLAACSDTMTPQGIVAVASIPRLEVNMSSSSSSSLILVLDGVADPGNLGTIVRSCYATGVAGILLLPLCSDPYSPKALRSSMGAAFGVPVQAVVGWKECYELLLQRYGCRDSNNIWAATMLVKKGGTNNINNDSPTIVDTAYYDVDWKSNAPVALIIGNEGKGLSNDVRQALVTGTVRPVHVPMANGESLNAAVCASVMLFEYQRQQQQQQQQQQQL